jgi:hypothetical protein
VTVDYSSDIKLVSVDYSSDIKEALATILTIKYICIGNW